MPWAPLSLYICSSFEEVWSKILTQLDLPGWNPKTSLWDLLESTLTYQHKTYAEAVKQAIAKPVAS